ncbi:hypothetical protein MGG_15743 [Pyricularia oryzae 70-15]|uniref:Uncharacterized protein n=2 Tax=Pyricularia oryzae TaxID=318829 RepID=G4MUB1_PYRO7|nr:uncharacterized protein MGG_15743 [Pyricularia oryzae 70-15]EHA54798.1 hypothetical protein MGG_15743 [Pyricularia oryzae 70-15]KAI7921922.1 hypothetical protein M9X92_005091 [Pyricularia oryzae]KAI7924322.1 hypothetical protein M0657_004667 [Pyricularia oryzae]QBZ56446.1 hypothetical protein PoMZ_01353 [Pyricularia oryzae]
MSGSNINSLTLAQRKTSYSNRKGGGMVSARVWVAEKIDHQHHLLGRSEDDADTGMKAADYCRLG